MIRLSAAQQKKLLAAMRLDKKVSAGEVKFVLAKTIGEVVWGQNVPDELIRAILTLMSTAPNRAVLTGMTVEGSLPKKPKRTGETPVPL